MLNLIHEKLCPGENQFFKVKKIKDSIGKILPIESFINIDEDNDAKYVEFLSQNEVEEYAQNYHKLTAAIYSRILKRDEEGLLVKYETQLKQKMELFKRHIINKRKLTTKTLELAVKQKELGANKKIIESFSSTEYLQISADLKTLTAQIHEIDSSSKDYNSLLNEILVIIDKYKQTKISNPYSQQIGQIIKGIEDLVVTTKGIDFTNAEATSSGLLQSLSIKRDSLRKYLSDKGLTEENQKDIANASLITSQLEQEILSKEEEILNLQRQIKLFDLSDIALSSSTYKQEFEKQIKNISNVLERLGNSAVKPITLQFEFDIEAATEAIFSDFKSIFEGAIIRSNHKGDFILKEVLFSLDPIFLSAKSELIEAIRKNNTTSAAKTFLLDLFSLDSNFEIYKLLVDRHYFDFYTYKRVKVQYDKRPIESSSFGQRCTAVMVILLLLGNNPIIIDEPEAHLDSLLISNYLVEVIKNRKQNRQIIFATHNANFVINGDAELVHILDIDTVSLTTSITSTTIENAQTREVLIGLEGGREAFRKRENRYQ